MTPVAAPRPTATATYPDLAGKVAVVTGGSRGIGAAAARALAANGVSVVVVGRDQAAIDNSVGAVRGMGAQALGVIADCTVDAELDALQQAVSAAFGRVDILAAFAGGNGMPVATDKEHGAHRREVVETDLTSTFLTVSAFLPGMLERNSGVIITMASSAAKAGVIALTRHLAGEFGNAGIRVNCIAPSAVENDRMRSWMTGEQRIALGGSFPLGRIGQPEDVAAATLFLASDASSWITGVTLDVAGGKVML